MRHLLVCAALFLASAPLAAKSPKAFTIVSWNVQTFGNVKPERRDAFNAASEAVISTSVHVIAAQEVANERSLHLLESLLPGGTLSWTASFKDTPDAQDNAILVRVDVTTITADGFLFEDPETGEPDRTKALHPVRWAHIGIGKRDFTLLSLHLTFKNGDASATKKEFLAILDWLVDYFKDPKSDPDVILAGDFNLPSEKGKDASKRGKEADWFTLDSIIQEHGHFDRGPHRLRVLVDEPTSRPNKLPANNYDHFIVSTDELKRSIDAERVPIDYVDRADSKVQARVSDHYPIKLFLGME
jgi:endonuclease/exonuclease/phosphatase family metal-dependent hydrolase